MSNTPGRGAVNEENKRQLESLNTREMDLRGMKDNLLAKFRSGPRKKAVARGKEEAISRVNANEAKDTHEVRKRPTKDERKTNYLESFKQVDENNEILNKKAYEEVFNFQYNRESFRGEGGWQEEYLAATDKDGLPLKDQVTLEEFVLEKQFLELEYIRESLMDFRIDKSIEQIYGDLKGEENIEARSKKAAEKKEAGSQFFINNKAKVEACLEAEGTEAEKLQKQLSADFRSMVFADAKINDPHVKAAIETLFNDLMADYQQMLVSRESVRSLNEVMVANMSSDEMDEDQWLEALARKAEEEAEKLKKQQEQKKAVDVAVQSVGTGGNFDSGQFGIGTISAAEKLSSDTNIAIINDGNGNYTVVFSQEQGMTQASHFQVKNVPDENGKSRPVYVFNDQLLNGGAAVVDDKAFKRQINALYLDHVMGQQDRVGKTDGRPDLNNVMPDEEMFEMAQLLFRPVDIEETPLNREQAAVFRNLMLILSGKANNDATGGEYGNLLAMRNRIDLLMFALKLDNGAKAKSCYNLLKGKNAEKFSKVGVAELCKQIGVKKTAGNVSHG